MGKFSWNHYDRPPDRDMAGAKAELLPRFAMRAKIMNSGAPLRPREWLGLTQLDIDASDAILICSGACALLPKL